MGGLAWLRGRGAHCLWGWTAFLGMFSPHPLCRRDRLEAIGEGEGVSVVLGEQVLRGGRGPGASDLASFIPQERAKGP